MSREKVKIGIAEDQTLFRQGLIQILNDFENVEVIVEAENGQEFLNKIENTPVDIAFFGLQNAHYEWC